MRRTQEHMQQVSQLKQSELQYLSAMIIPTATSKTSKLIQEMLMLVHFEQEYYLVRQTTL